MKGDAHFIAIGKEQLHYLRWGSGKRLLLAFHGYGDDARIFYPLKEYLSDQYTILSIDLPHHGNSKWPDDEQFKLEDLLALVDVLRKKYSVEEVSLMGYSMGGRVCLSIIEHEPQNVDKVVLIATDGLVTNPYYFFFTKTTFGKKMFRNMLLKPTRYLKTIEWLKKTNMVNASRYKFAMHFLQEENNRLFLLKVWPGMSRLMPSIPKLKTIIKKYHIPIAIFMGRHDKIIPASQAHKFASGLDSVQVHVLEKGHRLFDHETVPQIAALLL